MLALISPAKSMDMSSMGLSSHTSPRLMDHSQKLINNLSKKSKKSIKELMKVSDKITELNYHRFRNFSAPFTLENAKPTMFAFTGDVYQGLDASSFNKTELKYAQKHLGILSGLYGYLRPLDLIQAYRLEMGTKLKVGRAKNLYQFWDTKITELINEDLKAIKSNTIINLASNEYFKSIKKKELQADIIDIVFKEYRNNELKFISFSAKKARGLMCKYMIKNKLKSTEDLKGFNYKNYYFEESLSEESVWMFVR